MVIGKKEASAPFFSPAAARALPSPHRSGNFAMGRRYPKAPVTIKQVRTS
jgi:hypothetical protein